MVVLALVSIIPIAIVFIGLTLFKKPAYILAPIALVTSIIIAVAAFDTSMLQFAITDGVTEAGRVALMLWAAFTILEMEKSTGAIDVIKNSLSGVTKDKRILLVIIAMGFGAFLEGAAGSGSPAAVVAPMLVGLGYTPIVAVLAALVCNSFIVCWGAAGVTLTLGASPVTDIIPIADLNSGLGSAVGILGITLPFILIWAVYGIKGYKGRVISLIISGLSFGGAVYLSTSVLNFGPEVVGIFTGVSIIIITGVTAYFIKSPTAQEYLIDDSNIQKSNNNLSLWQAMAPYLLILVLLPLVRNTVPMSILTRYGYLMWIAVLLWICCILGSVFLKVKPKTLGNYARNTFKRMVPSFISLGCLLTLARVMRWSGMMDPLAILLGDAAGSAYPLAAQAIGSLGAFIAGTAATSNLMFNGLHVKAAQHIGDMMPITPVIMQHLGASIGNMICVHNVVAVAATVGLGGKEGEILRKVLFPFAIVFLVTAVVGFIVA